MDAVPALRSRDVHVIHDAWSADAGEILAAQPNLVLAAVPYRMESLAALLKAGRTVVAFAPKTLADIYADLLLLGRLVGRESAAASLVAGMQKEIADLRARVATIDHRPRVYCEEWGKPLIHSQPWVAELVEAAGGIFIGTPAGTTDAAAVAEGNPDVLIFAWCGAGDRVPLKRVIEQRRWTDLPAVRSVRVYCIHDEYLNTPAASLLHGLRAIAAALHPAVFGGAQGLRSIERVPMDITSI